jgi:hypothetical protein
VQDDNDNNSGNDSNDKTSAQAVSRRFAGGYALIAWARAYPTLLQLCALLLNLVWATQAPR